MNIARVTGRGIIFRTSPSDDKYPMAELVLSTEVRIAEVTATSVEFHLSRLTHSISQLVPSQAKSPIPQKVACILTCQELHISY